MKSWTLIIVLVVFNTLTFSQQCPDLLVPLDGATNVAVDAPISWEPVTGVTGYIISLGTTSGGVEIINEQTVGTATSFTPPVGMPDNTIIYVTITLFFFDQPDIVCTSQSFTTEDITIAPNCTMLNGPLNGDIDINVATNIAWNYVTGATGYSISIGSSPGLGDIVNSLDVGNSLTYNPILDLPFDTQIFVEIIPYNENGMAGSCTEESFTTGPLAILPSCTSIISPTDGETNVGLSPLIEWEAVAGATGYKVYIGNSPFDNDVLNGDVFTTNSTLVTDGEPNSIYFIRIIPFNDAGDAIGCGQTSFSTVLGCGPFFDVNTGELTSLNPILTLPNEVGLCVNNAPANLNAPDVADGYRWYKQDANGDFVLISDTADVQLSEEGLYRYEAYNNTSDPEFSIECASSSEFTVVTSEIGNILGANVTDNSFGLTIEIFVEGSGDYEYALDDINGPYQDSNYFSNASEDTSIGYVRDKNGCGIAQLNIEIYIQPEGFPKYFTPNDDGFNDYWQYKPSSDDNFQLEVIYIFDRYGKLLKTLSPLSIGWNGRLNDKRLYTSDYWYKAVTTNGDNIFGHFALKN